MLTARKLIALWAERDELYALANADRLKEGVFDRELKRLDGRENVLLAEMAEYRKGQQGVPFGCRFPHTRRRAGMSASLLEYLLHSAAGAGAATAAATLVSRALGGGLAVTSPEAVIRVIDDREKQSKPRVHNPKTVDGDQAEVDLGSLLMEINQILSTPGKMGVVDPQTLQVVREGR